MTRQPVRIRLSDTKGWRKLPNTVVVSRPSEFGNPFKVGGPGVPDAKTAVQKFSDQLFPFRRGGPVTDFLISEASIKWNEGSDA